MPFRPYTPDEVWSYSIRELTQSKFPFWSAIITQQQGSISVPASSTSTITIQPASDETWLIFGGVSVDTYDVVGHIAITDYDGATERTHYVNEVSSGSACGYHIPCITFTAILTNSLYLHLNCYNGASTDRSAYYGYSGFKLSKPQWSAKRFDDPRPWKRKAIKSLPTTPIDLTPLESYHYEIFDTRINDYRDVIMLEEDTPLAIDPNTNFSVERFTAYVYVDNFVKNLDLFKADPIKTGYKKYFDKWKSEGITIG